MAEVVMIEVEIPMGLGRQSKISETRKTRIRHRKKTYKSRKKLTPTTESIKPRNGTVPITSMMRFIHTTIHSTHRKSIKPRKNGHRIWNVAYRY